MVCCVSKILTLTGTHGYVVASMLAKTKDVRGSVCFVNCETEFRHSKCIRREGWRLQCCGDVWQAEEKSAVVDLLRREGKGYQGTEKTLSARNGELVA